MLLEGECRSFDNVKLNLMRRIKMLEYALHVERYEATNSPPSMSPSLTCRGCSSKQLAQPAAQSVPPTKLATLQSHATLHLQNDDASSGSSPRSEGTCPPCRATAFYSNVGRHASVFRLPAASRSDVCRFNPQWGCFGWPA